MWHGAVWYICSFGHLSVKFLSTLFTFQGHRLTSSSPKLPDIWASDLFFYPNGGGSRFPPERRHPSNKLHGVTTQDTVSEPPHLTLSLCGYRNLHKIIPCWKNNTFKRVFTIAHLEIPPYSQVHTAFMLMLLMTWCWEVLTSGGLQWIAFVPSFTKIRHCP